MIRALASALCLSAAPVAAHPHMFVDAGLELIFDEAGRLAAVRVAWVYDAFSSMLYLDDLGLDPALTGPLAPADAAVLHGFDMNWQPDFAGDLVLMADGAPVALSGPLDWTTDLDAGGRIVSTHLRALEARPEAAAEIVLRVYDPTYFTAYTIVAPPRFTGRSDCTGTIWEPDLSAAGAALEAALEELYAGATDFDIEEDFPPVGALFAEEARVTCATPS